MTTPEGLATTCLGKARHTHPTRHARHMSSVFALVPVHPCGQRVCVASGHVQRWLAASQSPHQSRCLHAQTSWHSSCADAQHALAHGAEQQREPERHHDDDHRDHRPARPFEWWQRGQFIRYTTTVIIPRTAPAAFTPLGMACQRMQYVPVRRPAVSSQLCTPGSLADMT